MNDQEKLGLLIQESFDEQYKKRGLLTACHTAEYLIAHGVKVMKPQKLLTVEEATGTLDIVWFEQKHLDTTYPCDAVIAPDCVNVNMSMIGHSVPLVRLIKDYGKTWRCWEEKPTEAERKAAEWE